MNPFWVGILLGMFLGANLGIIIFALAASGPSLSREWEAFRRGYDTGITEGTLRKDKE